MRNPWVHIPPKTWLPMKELKDERSKNKLKCHACDCVLHHICSCSYYKVGFGVVQMVLYFKTSQSIRLIVPFQVRTVVNLTKPTSQNVPYVHSSVPGEKTNTLSTSQWSFHNSNMSWNVCGGMYIASCEKGCFFLRIDKLAIFELNRVIKSELGDIEVRIVR